MGLYSHWLKRKMKLTFGWHLCGRGLVPGGLQGGFCEKQKLPLCLIEPIPTGSKKVPLLAKVREEW